MINFLIKLEKPRKTIKRTKNDYRKNKEKRSSVMGKGLYHNMNKRKKAGTSRSKKDSTISDKAYKNMLAGFPKKKKKTTA